MEYSRASIWLFEHVGTLDIANLSLDDPEMEALLFNDVSDSVIDIDGDDAAKAIWLENLWIVLVEYWFIINNCFDFLDDNVFMSWS